MDDLRVDVINDKHVTSCGEDVAMHRDHTVLDVAHEILRIKIPLLDVFVPSLVQISASQWAGSDIRLQHHPGQRRGSSPV